MAEFYKKIHRWDWEAMLDLFEAVTGYNRNQVVEGSIRVVSRDDDEVVAEFLTLDPNMRTDDPEDRYQDHTVRLHPGEELKETQS